MPNYGAYGTKGRAEYYRERAEGHNTLVINPGEDSMEQNFNEVGRIVDFESAPCESFGVLDLSGPYNQKAESVKRGFYVGDYRNSLTKRDEMKLIEKKNTVYWFMHTNIMNESDIELGPNYAILTDGDTGNRLYLEFATNASAEIKVMDSKPLETSPNPAQGSNPGKKIAIVLNGAKNINLTVKMCDYDNWKNGLISPINTSSIKDWTVSDAPMPEKPKLSGLYVNGALIDGFNPDTLTYNLPDISVHDQSPEITYPNSDEYTVKTEKSRRGYIVTVRNSEAPILCTKYVINIKQIPDIMTSLSDFTRLQPKSIKASRVPQAENPPENVSDGDTSTRFAVDGSREWIELDMGEVVEADGYAISYFSGTTRDSYYDILVSDDGVNYTTIAQSITSGKTPLILSRYAGPGSHRYPIGFSGDTVISWASLAFQPYFTANASNIGYCWWSHDIGGHMRGYRDEELSARWVQFGVFSPINRLHSDPNRYMGKEPWNFNAIAEDSMKKFLKLRHELIPYIYPMNYRTNKYGEALMRPMYYTWGKDSAAYECPSEYSFVTQMIVSPIVTPAKDITGLADSEMYIPAGIWYDFFIGRKYSGAKTLKMHRDLSKMPVLVKAGGIVPMAELLHVNDVENPQKLTVKVYAEESGRFELYEDNEKDNAAITVFELNWCEKPTVSVYVTGDIDVIPKGREYRFEFIGMDNIKCAGGYSCEGNLIKVSGGNSFMLEIESFDEVANDTEAWIDEILLHAKMDNIKKESIYYYLTGSPSNA